MQDFHNLKVWAKGHEPVLAVYRTTASFPADELYGLRSQMRRCAVSIPANIAEGCGRGSNADLARFLLIAMGSASELEYFSFLARDLDFIPVAQHEHLAKQATQIRRMLTGLLRKLKRPPPNTDN